MAEQGGEASAEAEELGIDALSFIAADPVIFSRLLRLTGLELENLDAAVDDPAFLAAVLDFVLSDERLLAAFVEQSHRSPDAARAARRALSGPPLRWRRRLNRTELTSAGPDVLDLPRRHDGLVVLDVDEVVLHFIAPFQDLLASFGARLHFDSFKMTGNVRSQSTGAALTGHELDRSQEQLFREQETRQPLVAEARDAIRRLSGVCDVVFLTAMPPSHYDARRRLLDREGLAEQPLIATLRSKGAVIAEMAQRWRGPIVFVDDLPSNLEGVRRSVPNVHLVHMMADRNFRPHLPPLPADTREAADWREAETILRDLVEGRA